MHPHMHPHDEGHTVGLPTSHAGVVLCIHVMQPMDGTTLIVTLLLHYKHDMLKWAVLTLDGSF